MHLYVHSIPIYNSQDLETAQVPISRRVDKIAMVHLHNGILFSCKKEGKFTLCDSMNGAGLDDIMLSELSQSEKHKYHMISLLCGI